MTSAREELRRQARDKTAAEVAQLEQRGLVLAGNGFASVLLVKGEPGPAEAAGGVLLSGADGAALHAALERLGYAPEDWCALSAVTAAGAPVDPEGFRLALAALSPSTVILCDETAANLARETLAPELVALPRLECAMLQPGYVTEVLGLRLLNLGGFEAALADPAAKQLQWAYLKQLPPLGEPY
ncbi:MAG: hypothetical protein HFJ63_01180 [Atopobiaceae bacterium]|uniref:Uncharacterized protein n=1 Tax=Muricaecibacterium torontonense TaxID=3032871 RepID=A0A4S2F296_9ACTN|nr:hypothetical protein [Muricaecibacterium torontonense]MCI8675320.1 hypothetical protein [Atopobiaceae bacterium]TGY63069.1 hypothetical protein E5334_00670 [Muricaecibacterium torontonense]